MSSNTIQIIAPRIKKKKKKSLKLINFNFNIKDNNCIRYVNSNGIAILYCIKF